MTDDEERRAIVAEVARWAWPAGLESWQFTVYDYVPAKGLSLSRAASRLKELVAEGRLRTAMVTHNGKRVRAYWRPEDEPK